MELQAAVNQPVAVNPEPSGIVANLRHLSIIEYEIPSQRLRAVMTGLLKTEESFVERITGSRLSIVSFLDQGAWRGQGAFEQTSYLLHVVREGEPWHFLLGISVGALSAVAIRNLWPMPWHLSAMEFQVSYNSARSGYGLYRLRSQSQWANASWEIQDTGDSIHSDPAGVLPVVSSISAGVSRHHFPRRDGTLGLCKLRYRGLALTSGRLRQARSDVLERWGLIQRDELLRPSLVAMQHQASCQIF